MLGDFKDLPKRATTDKALRDKAFNIVKNPKYNGYQRRTASVSYKFFDKEASATRASKFTSSNTSGGAAENKTMSHQ